VAACVGVGFGLLSAIALREVSSVHGAVLAAAAVIAATAVGRNARVGPARSAAQDGGSEAGYPPAAGRLGLPAVPP